MDQRMEDKVKHTEKCAPVAGGDKVRGTEVDNEQGTLKTWDATMMTRGLWRVLSKDILTLLF